MFHSEQVNGIVDSRMVFEIYFQMLDCFTYCIFSDIEVVNIFDRCGVGPIYTSLIVIVIGYRGWSVCVMPFEVVEDVAKMLSNTGGFIS
jgi:hypothetical protein